jgi:hypothetical protein
MFKPEDKFVRIAALKVHMPLDPLPDMCLGVAWGVPVGLWSRLSWNKPNLWSMIASENLLLQFWYESAELLYRVKLKGATSDFLSEVRHLPQVSNLPRSRTEPVLVHHRFANHTALFNRIPLAVYSTAVRHFGRGG